MKKGLSFVKKELEYMLALTNKEEVGDESMLQIKNISKQYKTGDLVQNALNGVSLNFRDNEFVSILGPSGSGKTTLLNIIGGLDRYDSGDLIINNVSTKNYKDRDWDSYRNHTIGFVFQSYNLIPHQTVLANVELALTIGGISKKERKKRALDALEQVGLREQAHKRPNQMSGGQMQRVAIARALVNNPDILLADEPTGALDTETSVQVMELLKKVAHDRLVIMVTHNPELAEQYSTRIVKLKDGKILDDSDPFQPDEAVLAPPEHKNLGKSSMSILTAFSLSMNNLLTKKARTLLTSFAGSIGIIGIALILALSTGFQNYIDKIQEDTLTSYPLTLTSETADVTSALLSMATKSGEETDSNKVEERQYISTMFSEIGTNDLKSFKEYLEQEADTVDDMVSLVRYQYSVNPLIYAYDSTEELVQLNPSTLLSSLSGGSSMSSMVSMGGSSSIFYEMTEDQKTLEDQYDVLAGTWPKAYDEAILVLPEPNGMPDLLVYSLGLRSNSELKDMLSTVMAGDTVDDIGEPLDFTYDDLMNLEFKVVDASATYRYNKDYEIYEDMSEDKDFMKKVYDSAEDLKIVGVVCAKEGVTATNLTAGVAYTKALTEHVIDLASQSEIVKKQMEQEEVDVFSNKRFDEDKKESGLDFQDLISIDEKMLSEAFGVNISEEDISNMTQGYMTEISSAITTDTSEAEKDFNSVLTTLAVDLFEDYIDSHKDPVTGGAKIQMSQVEQAVSDFMALDSTKAEFAKLEEKYLIPQDTFSALFSELFNGLLKSYISMAAMDPTAEDLTAFIMPDMVEMMVEQLMAQEAVTNMSQMMAGKMTEAVMQKTILTKVGELSGKLMGSMAEAFHVDQSKIAGAFQFQMNESELSRIMETMTSSGVEQNANTNLLSLGYQDMEEPSSISFYFQDFESKEKFVDFLDAYNEKMEQEDEEKVIKYTDITGILMSSVKTIVDSVSYVLIAFVSISLIVSSIMIGIITYISVLERTKEIGVLRAIGASKKNISSIFNAETFIVGLCAGLLGILVSLVLLIPINHVIHSVTGNMDITAVLPWKAATVLVLLSIVLTLIGGLIPSKQAANKDPVLALRSE